MGSTIPLENRRTGATDVWPHEAAHPDWTSGKAVGADNWYEMKGPISGCRYSSSFAWQDRLRHELYIDTGDGEKNMKIYEHLRNRQEQLAGFWMLASGSEGR
jgi:hypothetical protein